MTDRAALVASALANFAITRRDAEDMADAVMAHQPRPAAGNPPVSLSTSPGASASGAFRRG